MRVLRTFLTSLLFGLSASIALAGERPVVVVELFTSQGCSSCPPADRFLGQLAQQPGVLPLAMHVDYWDYIGWNDTFARAEHTKRQKAYAYAFGTKSIYTPQMVIGGVDQAVGSNVMKVMDFLHHHQMAMGQIRLRTEMADETRVLHMVKQAANTLSRPVFVQMVHFIPTAQVKIKRGENAGHTLTYSNIVTGISFLGEWDGGDAAKFDLPTPLAPDGQKAAIVLQSTKGNGLPGAILAALELD